MAYQMTEEEEIREAFKVRAIDSEDVVNFEQMLEDGERDKVRDYLDRAFISFSSGW